MNLIDTEIPVYNLMQCVGGTDFAITRFKPQPLFSKLQIPHRQEGYTVSLLLRGKLTKYIDFQKHEIEAPAIISMAPEQIHQYVDTQGCEMICISFSRDFLISEMQGWMACWECMFGHVVMDINEEDLDELKVYTDLMLEEFQGNKSKKEIVLRNILHAFIICCARLQNKDLPVMQMDPIQNKLVYQFKLHVDLHYKEKTQVAQYADMLYITPGHLNDVIKSTVGKTAKQVIDEKRVTEAKRLLFWGGQSMKEIAWLLHFEDDAYFNRFFKKHTGQTPSFFQRTIREKYN